MASGNPAKKALDQQRQETKKKLEQCVQTGQWMVYRPFEHTEVRVKSSDMREAEMVNEWMMPVTEYDDPAGLAGIETSWWYLCMFIMGEKRWRKAMKETLDTLTKAYEQECKWHDEHPAPKGTKVHFA